MIAPAHTYQILVADDEPDVYAVTRLALRGLQYQKRPVELLFATSGAETVQTLKSNPMIAVLLLDVVMETDSAGLDACRAIRGELNNPFVRILLRTGQPGSAPERKTIDDYDLDGYLPKSELTSTRLYSAVRTALKAWEELVELDRHRRYLAAIHDCAVSLHSFDTLPVTLERILGTAVTLCPSPLALLRLETFGKEGNPQRHFLHVSTDPDPVRAEAVAFEVCSRLARDPHVQALRTLTPFHQGVLVPLVLHHELGNGWLYLENVQPDTLTSHSLTLLAGHAVNALYSAVAQELLSAREVGSPDALPI